MQQQPHHEQEHTSVVELEGESTYSADFEALLDLEERFIDEGWAEGKRNAEQAGFQDGRGLGLSKGRELGEELGFYYGCVVAWSQMANSTKSSHPYQFSQRTLTALSKLKEKILAFPANPTDENLQEALDSIRANFKKVSAMLKVKRDKASGSSTKGELSF
ncbi:hypothetical protein QOT17_024633 [Balamuthia mandrillaris]